MLPLGKNMIVKYALIRNGKILKLRNLPDDDTLLIGKMLANGYLPVVEDAIPIFDYITQSVSETYEISVDKVTRKWTVFEQQFDEAKRMKEEEIKSKAIDYIRATFDDDNADSAVNDTFAAKKAEFMMALHTAKSNTDLRKIDVEYSETQKKMMGV